MTNREDDSGPTRDPCLAGLLAVHLVSQVLDEAYVIAKAASDTGQPWRHMSMLTNFKSDRLSETYAEDESFVASKGDVDIVNENKMELAANIVATSTPQKVTGYGCMDTVNDKACRTAKETFESLNNEWGTGKPKSDAGFIGQGDEDLELHQNELTKSTSMFLNHLFDMSEVERVVICDDADLATTDPDSNDLLTQAMTKIMESYINTALGMAYDQNIQLNDEDVPIETSSTEHSDYSFLADAFAVDIGRDLPFYIHSDVTKDNNFNDSHTIEPDEFKEPVVPKVNLDNIEVARYEHAYLTLNRDYEQCSDDDADPILQDPKGMTLQEVELLTANTSDDNLIVNQEIKDHAKCQQLKELTATSGISAAASGSRKSTLVRRCRLQGARLFACLRGWWRRKTPGKRKEVRGPGSIREICPLSPDARRRASSLLDQRLLRSPSPSRPVVWKFNTVNEALVNSSHWKDYTFDSKPDECGEY